MPKVTDQPTIESRKVDHIKINLEKDVQFPTLTTGLEKFRFMHHAVPELDLAQIDTSNTIFSKKLAAPILISSMTGGADMAQKLNENLAIIAQEHGFAMGIGSQRAAIEDEQLAQSYKIRSFAPDALLLANIGAVQFNYGYDVSHCQRAIDMIKADALILHFNVLQEAVQPEGDTNFANLLPKIEQVCKSLDIPVIAKEVGWGFSPRDVRLLADVGISAIDVAGSGGTSWSEVEYHRAPTSFHAQVAASFADWGIPTADAIQYVHQTAPDMTIIASGGLRNGIDVAKCIALGSDLCGLAGPFLKTAANSLEAADQFSKELVAQLKIAMLCTNSENIPALKQAELISTQG